MIKVMALRYKYLLSTLLFIIGISKLLFINILITEMALRNKTARGQTFRISNPFILTSSVTQRICLKGVFVQ